MVYATDVVVRHINVLNRTTHTINFRDDDGVAYDPTTVSFTYDAPNATPVTYTYGEDAQITRLSLGVYRISIWLQVAGWHYTRWYGQGPGSSDVIKTGAVEVRANQIN